MLIIFVVIYDRFSKPINRLQTEAARRSLDKARALQETWDRSFAEQETHTGGVLRKPD